MNEWKVLREKVNAIEKDNFDMRSYKKSVNRIVDYAERKKIVIRGVSKIKSSNMKEAIPPLKEAVWNDNLNEFVDILKKAISLPMTDLRIALGRKRMKVLVHQVVKDNEAKYVVSMTGDQFSKIETFAKRSVEFVFE